MSALDLHARYRDEVPGLAVDWDATPVPDPQLVVHNDRLAEALGLDAAWLRSPAGVTVLAGNAVPAGARPVAMAYAGHQFGNYNPQLGDGRALLLGEIETPDGALVDLHLKGTGRTPFARGGDGRASLGPMLREFVIAEAMHALGVPTTRSLAVVVTGETVPRQRVEPGAVLARVAASHVRVGTFQYARFVEDPAVLVSLLDHAIARHAPDAADAPRPALAFLDHVIAGQAELVARWMTLGFIHGVMNTDNMAVSGEGIDYGPCAFMDRFDPATVFSSIDHAGRYAYGNQPAIAQWNLTRLAESMLVLIDDDRDTAVAQATEALERFPERYQEAWTTEMSRKLGFGEDRVATADLLDGLTALEAVAGADHTSTFRALADALRGDRTALHEQFPEHRSEIDDWVDEWTGMLGAADRDATAAAMDAVNPVHVPRNHLVEEALDAAVLHGDFSPFGQLVDVVTDPYRPRTGAERYAQPAPDGFTDRYQTFCGT